MTPPSATQTSPGREEEIERFRELKATNDPALRAQLIADHVGLARHAARRFAQRGEELDDLIQVASFALVKAVDRFDPEQGTRFATFALPTMLGELRRHFRDKTWAMRVPRRIKELHLDIRKMSEELSGKLNRKPTIDELAIALETTPDAILETLDAGANYRAVSLDQPTTVDGDEPSGTFGAEDEELEASPERVELTRAMGELSERDRTIVYLYFFEECTQSEISERVGVSQVHVSRLLRSSLEKLREVIEDPDESAASSPLRLVS